MLKELIELYTQGESKYNVEVLRKIDDLRRKFYDLEFWVNNIGHVIDFERYVILNKGSNKIWFEEKVLELLQMLVVYLCEKYDINRSILNKQLINDTHKPELKQVHSINLLLFDFANELFNVSIPRDSFSSKRKGYGLGLISRLLKYYEISNGFDLFIVALKSSKDKMIIEALIELHNYFENFPGKVLPQEIITVLDKLILKTKNKSVATGALNLQVITGHISEMNALSRIDDWKYKRTK